MNHLKSSFAIALLAMIPGLAAAADSGRLLPAAAGDLVPTRLLAAKVVAAPGVERAPVQFSWALNPAGKLAAPSPYLHESREFWTEVSGSTLAKGVVLHATAPGAVVRISPYANAASKALATQSVRIRKDGRDYDAGNAIDHASDAKQLAAAGAEFASGTIAFQVRPELGSGRFELAVAGAGGSYLLHVYEPQSTDVLELTTDRSIASDGGGLRVIARYRSAEGKALGRIAGVVTAPGGDSADITFIAGADDSWVAEAKRMPKAAGPGLFEVHAFATTSDGAVQRDAKTAFSVAGASARFAGTAEGSMTRTGAPSVRFAVEAASAGRYNVSAVLYGTDAKGSLVPAAIAHSAAWLESGTSTLGLAFARDAIAEHGLSAPFEVRDLTLTNQMDMDVLEKRARAYVIE